MLNLTIKIKGHTGSDLEYALEEVKRLVSEGFHWGFDSNSTGKFNFQIKGSAVENTDQQ